MLRSHPELWKLASLQFLAYVSHEVFVIWALYAIYRFSWSQTMIGASLAVVGIFTAAISGGLTGRIVAWLGERRTLYIGQFFGAVGMVIAGLARTSLVYIASIPVISMWNISFPAAQGMMTHRVSEREQDIEPVIRHVSGQYNRIRIYVHRSTSSNDQLHAPYSTDVFGPSASFSLSASDPNPFFAASSSGAV